MYYSTRTPTREALVLVIIVISCIFMISGILYSVMIVPGMGSEMIQQSYNVASSKYTVIIITFITPNLIFPILGGVLIDISLGVRWSMILFYFTCVLGQVIWFGAYYSSTYAFDITLIGILIIGIGIGCMLTSQYVACAYFFAGKYFTTLCASVSLFRYVVYLASYQLTVYISTSTDTPTYSIGIGIIVLGISFIFIIGLFVYLRTEKHRVARPRNTIIPISFKLTALFLLYLYLLCLLSSISILYRMAPKMLANTYNISHDNMMTFAEVIVPFLVVSVLVGSLIVDIVGYHLVFLVSGALIYNLSLACFIWFTIVPYWIWLIIMIIGFTCALYPSISIVPFLLKKKYWGRGYSGAIVLLTISQIIGFCLYHNVSDMINEIVMYTLSFISIICMVLLNYMDYKYGQILNHRPIHWRDLLYSNLK